MLRALLNTFLSRPTKDELAVATSASPSATPLSSTPKTDPSIPAETISDVSKVEVKNGKSHEPVQNETADAVTLSGPAADVEKEKVSEETVEQAKQSEVEQAAYPTIDEAEQAERTAAANAAEEEARKNAEALRIAEELAEKVAREAIEKATKEAAAKAQRALREREIKAALQLEKDKRRRSERIENESRKTPIRRSDVGFFNNKKFARYYMGDEQQEKIPTLPRRHRR